MRCHKRAGRTYGGNAPQLVGGHPARIVFGSGSDAATWRVRAHNFRVLAEPFDIANYYNLGLHLQPAHTPSGFSHYLESDNRPWVSCHLLHLGVGTAVPCVSNRILLEHQIRFEHQNSARCSGTQCGWLPFG